jgi:hypothetical protein
MSRVKTINGNPFIMKLHRMLDSVRSLSPMHAAGVSMALSWDRVLRSLYKEERKSATNTRCEEILPRDFHKLLARPPVLKKVIELSSVINAHTYQHHGMAADRVFLIRKSIVMMDR